MIITEILAQNARYYPKDVALVELNPQFHENPNVTWKEFDLVEALPNEKYRRELTWEEFEEKANSFANILLEHGVCKGDKIAILLMNCLEWLPIYFGILKTGAVVVPMNFRYSAEEIKYCLELSQADMLIFGDEFIDRVGAIVKDIKNVKYLIHLGEYCPDFAESYGDMMEGASKSVVSADLSEDDDAAIYFSSGTTGFPKAILHAHKSLMCACYTENNHHGQTKDDTFLCIPPLYHTGAKMHWFGSFLVGGKAILLRGTKPEWILKAVSDEYATIVWLLVPWAQDILDAVDRGDIKLENYRLSQWRLMHIGAQPVPPSLIKRWKAYFPEHLYDTNYGLSEAIGPGCVHLGIENIDKIGSIGKAGYGWQTKIVDEKGDLLPKNKIGELAVSGDGLMKCYFRDPVATGAVLRDGWLLTGDMAYADEDGFIYLVDRKKDVIISGGENLYPVEIENFIRKHDAVKDVAVIGLADSRLGEIAAAIIEIKPGYACTPEEIERFCMDMPRYKRPKKIIFDTIPRNPTGKIEKPKLREKYRVDGLVGKLTHS
jgi:acyl-CoA synthetase (AMP-forming)/AMP-acid ligase II